MSPHEFAFFSFNKSDVAEIYRGLLARFLMQSRLRHEQGLEDVPYPTLLERLEQVLGYSDDDAHRIFHLIEDELWEHSWFSFTDEWAWFRARQEVMKEMHETEEPTDEPHKQFMQRITEKRYAEQFDRYAEELDMSAQPPKPKKHARHKQRKK